MIKTYNKKENTYNTNCNQDEKTLPIRLNNPKESKIIICNGSIGQTFEEIETDSKTIYNIAFMENLFNKNELLDNFFSGKRTIKRSTFLSKMIQLVQLKKIEKEKP